jgi:hypothetical protein
MTKYMVFLKHTVFTFVALKEKLEKRKRNQKKYLKIKVEAFAFGTLHQWFWTHKLG